MKCTNTRFSNCVVDIEPRPMGGGGARDGSSRKSKSRYASSEEIARCIEKGDSSFGLSGHSNTKITFADENMEERLTGISCRRQENYFSGRICSEKCAKWEHSKAVIDTRRLMTIYLCVRCTNSSKLSDGGEMEKEGFRLLGTISDRILISAERGESVPDKRRVLALR